MRTNEERITAMHCRTKQLYRERKSRRFALLSGVSAAVCIGLLVGMSVLIPHVSRGAGFTADISDSMNASIFAGAEALGYIVIAILAFLLGVTVTVFCFRLKRYLDEKDREDFR